MTIQEEIDKAIAAHSMWKARLKQAVDTGKFDASIDDLRSDNHCPFGQWLYGNTLTSQEKSSSPYLRVHELHAEFHKTAARVAQLAISGKKAEAVKLMDSGGTYADISAQLTVAMLEWKKHVG